MSGLKIRYTSDYPRYRAAEDRMLSTAQNFPLTDDPPGLVYFGEVDAADLRAERYRKWRRQQANNGR